MTWTKWSGEQEQFLLDNYRLMPPAEIGGRLGYSAASVCGKARRLGLALRPGERQASDAAAERARQCREDWAHRRASQPEKPQPKPPGARAAMRRQQVAKIVCSMEAHVGKRGDALEIAERVAARKAPDRRCAMRAGGVACFSKAVKGRMWCPDCQARVDALRAGEAA
jgi:hypothetical protein